MEQIQSLRHTAPEDATQARPAPRFYIPSLDGLRALAFLLVFCAHSGLGDIIPGGSFGVTIFFFMSGYLITTLLRREQERSGTIDFKQFYFRRVLRILPLFYGALGLGLLITALGWLPQSWSDLSLPATLSQVFHFSNYWIAFKGYDGQVLGTDVFWSLAVEEHFYLIFPLIYSLLLHFRLSPKQQAWSIWGLCLLILLWRCVLVFGFHVPEDRTYMGSDTRFDSILFGCALAVYHNPMLDQGLQRWSNRTWKWVWLPLGLGLLACTVLIDSPAFRDTFRYTVQGIGLYPVFITAIRFPNWGAFRLLNDPRVRFIGLLSYALYLTHRTIGYAIAAQWPEAPLLLHVALMLAMSLGVSWLIHIGIEQPIERYKNRQRAKQQLPPPSSPPVTAM